METRAKKKSGLSMRSGSRRNLMQHTAEPMMAMSSQKNNKIRKPEVNTMVLPPPKPLPGQEGSRPSRALLSPPDHNPLPCSSTGMLERAESTPKRKMSRKSMVNKTPKKDVSTPNDKQLIPEGEFSPIELYPSSQTEALVRWDWQRDNQDSPQTKRGGGRLSTSASPEPYSLKRRSPSPEPELSQSEPPAKKLASCTPSALSDLEQALLHVQARVSQLSPVAEAIERSDDEEDSYHDMLSLHSTQVQEAKSVIVSAVATAVTEQSKPEVNKRSVEPAAIVAKPSSSSECPDSTDKPTNERSTRADAGKLMCAKPVPIVNQTACDKLLSAKSTTIVPAISDKIVHSDDAKKVAGEVKTVEEDLLQDDSMLECLIACSMQAEEECRLSQEMMKNVASRPNASVPTKSNVNTSTNVPSKAAVKPTPQVPTASMANKPGSNVASNPTKLKANVPPKTSTNSTFQASSSSTASKPGYNAASKPNVNSTFVVPSKPSEKLNCNMAIKAAVQGSASVSSTGGSRLRTVTSTMLPPPRRSPRTLSATKKTSPHKRSISPGNKPPLVLSQSTAKTDFDPSWVADIKSAASPMHSSLSNRSFSESQSSQFVATKNSGSQISKCVDSKGISRTLFSSPLTSTEKPSPKPTPNSKANKSFDPFEDSFDAAFDNFDEIDQIVLSQLEKPEEKKLSSQFQSSFLPSNDKVSLQVTTSSQNSSSSAPVTRNNPQHKPVSMAPLNKQTSFSSTNTSSGPQKPSGGFQNRPASLPVNSVQGKPTLLQTKSSSFSSNSATNKPFPVPSNAMQSKSLQNKPSAASAPSKPGCLPQVDKTSSFVGTNVPVTPSCSTPVVPQNQLSASYINSSNTRQSTRVAPVQSNPGNVVSNVPIVPTNIRSNVETNSRTTLSSSNKVQTPQVNRNNIPDTKTSQINSNGASKVPTNTAPTNSSVARSNLQPNSRLQTSSNSTNKVPTAQVNGAVIRSNLQSTTGAQMNSNFNNKVPAAQINGGVVRNNLQSTTGAQMNSNFNNKVPAAQINGGVVRNNLQSTTGAQMNSNFNNKVPTAQTNGTGNIQNINKPQVTSSVTSVAQISGTAASLSTKPLMPTAPLSTNPLAQPTNVFTKPHLQSSGLPAKPSIQATNMANNRSSLQTNMSNKPLMQTTNVINKLAPQTANTNTNKPPQQSTNVSNNKLPIQTTNMTNRPLMQTSNMPNKPPIQTANINKPPLQNVNNNNKPFNETSNINKFPIQPSSIINKPLAQTTHVNNNNNIKPPQHPISVVNNKPPIQTVNMSVKPSVPASSTFTRPPLSTATSSNAQTVTSRPAHFLGGSVLTRHKSADFAPVNNKPLLPSTVNQVRSTASPLLRHKSVGDFSSAPPASQRCTAEEIERKRQEAKQRLILRRQQQQQGQS